MVAVQGVPQYFYAHPGTFPSFQPNGLRFSQTPQQFGNVRHTAQQANCRMETEQINRQECQTRLEQQCQTGKEIKEKTESVRLLKQQNTSVEEMLVEEIEYILKCQEVVDQACGQVVQQDGQFNPSAPQFRHRCHDLPRQVCLPEGQKKEVLKPVEKCWNVQKVRSREAFK